MNRIKNFFFNFGKVTAATALLAGASSVKVACWVWFCQPEVPAELMKK